MPGWHLGDTSWEWPRRLAACLLEAQAGLMNCFCPMELHPEFGLDHPPAVSSTLELVEFSVTVLAHVSFYKSCPQNPL